MMANTREVSQSRFTVPSDDIVAPYACDGMSKPKFKKALLLFLAAMLSMHLVIAWNARRLVYLGYPDFTTFYTGGIIVREHLGAQLYDEQTQYRVQQQFAPGVIIRHGPLPYIHPPFEALVFVPLAWLSYPAAFLVWDCISVAILIATMWLIRPHVSSLNAISVPAWIFIWLAFFPVFFGLLQGQDIFVLLLLFVLAFVALKQERDLAAGCILSLGLFRFHLVVAFLFILLLQKRYKAVMGFIGSALLLALLSIGIVGWRQAVQYPAHVWRLEQSMERRGTIVPIRMANVRGLLDSALLPHTSKVASDVVIAAVSLALIIWGSRRWRSSSPDEFDLGFALCVVITILVGYHTLPYDLSLLLLPLTLIANHLLRHADEVKQSRAILFVPMLLLFFTPLQAFLLMRNGHYNLMAMVMLFWIWAISREISCQKLRAVEKSAT